MKLNHNKKRNTAFLYETLIKELTKASIKKDKDMMSKVLVIMKEHFNKNTILKQELEIYKSLYETKGVNKDIASSIMTEARRAYSGLSTHDVFNAQNKLIDDINKTLPQSVYNNYVSNYKDLATINQIFSLKTPVKSKVILEKSFVNEMSTKPLLREQTEEVADKTAMKLFSKAFNKEYANLLESQKALLSNYVKSFEDGGLQLSVYLNEEIGELKEFFTARIEKEEGETRQGVQKIVELLESYKGSHITEKILAEIIKMQDLKSELEKND